MLILEILDGDRTQSGSFWKVLKKCCCHHPINPKKPKVPPGIAPVVLKKLDRVEVEAMTGVEPSALLTHPLLPPFSSLLDFLGTVSAF